MASGWPVGGGWGGLPVRRPLSPGVGSGGVGGQRLHLAKSVLGSLRWPVGGRWAEGVPVPSVASRWPVSQSGGEGTGIEGKAAAPYAASHVFPSYPCFSPLTHVGLKTGEGVSRC